jgi:hypothetical protein
MIPTGEGAGGGDRPVRSAVRIMTFLMSQS